MSRLTVLAFMVYATTPIASAHHWVDSRSAMSSTEASSPESPGMQAADALEELGQTDLSVVAEALRKRDWQSLHANGPRNFSSRRAIAPLMIALEDQNPVVRRIAAWALGEIRSPEAINSLRPLLLDTVPEVRAQAARSLGDIGEREPVHDLIVTLSDPDPRVRLRAAHALGDIHDVDAMLPLRALAREDPVATIRAKAEWAVREIMEASGEQESVSLDDLDPDARRQAAHIMGDRRDRDSVHALIVSLRDRAPEVRLEAAWALGEIRDAIAVNALMKVAGDENEDVAIRRKAIRGLGQIGDPSAMPLLLRMIDHHDWRLRSQAADAMGDVGADIAVGSLTRALNDEHEIVRDNARKALRKIK